MYFMAKKYFKASARQIVFILLIGFSSAAFSQNTFLKFGVLKTQFKSETGWKNNYWPGFQISIAGITFTQYSGGNFRLLEDTNNRRYSGGGRYYNFGYTFSTKKRIKFPILNRMSLSVTPSIGGFRFHGITNFHVGITPGATFRIYRKLSVYGDLQMGKNFMQHPIEPYMTPVYSGAEKYFNRFFMIPSFGIKWSSSFKDMKGETIVSKDRLTANDEYIKTEGGYNYYNRTYIQSHIELPSYNGLLNIATKVYAPGANDYSNRTMAAGLGLAFRYGLFAFDIDYVAGRLGYRVNDKYGNPLQLQNYWKFNYTSFGLGINLLGIIQPAAPASLYRVIVGRKFGVGSFVSKFDGWTEKHAASNNITKQDIHFKGLNIWYLAFEIGRFAVNIDYYKMKDPLYRSRVFSASYFIPIVKAN